ncbi:MAG: DEAD/DEAH box helicase family protein [Desulfobacteraceae bacterium]|nr:DEAD/DEAH box helicase family protein [Desulfobacteraceae bacterium]MBC2748824.1 DEAD/DEAH box helicase family protein [Desulfobacteraceae bacterium]
MHGEWRYSLEHRQLCQVIETQTLWDETTCRIWLPGLDSVVRVPVSRLTSLEDSVTGTADGISYVASAARVAEALTQDVLLAPIESSVIPLPHQIKALSRATSGDRIRYLLADEVGLGKTIEAGLILRELKLRGLVKRVLVIAPKGLLTQWVAEMRTHFNEDFRLLIPSDFSAYRRIAKEDNIWQSHPQVVCPMDSVKPLEIRRGWSAKQVADYNQERFESLVSAGWDLVIVDEAHRLGGSTDQVARFKLGQGLCEAAPYFLMLSATPHQGKTDAFHRLVSLLDAQAFPDVGSVTRDRVQPYVIRTEKRHAITAEGNPLFKPRKTELAPVSWGKTHRDQQLLYEAVTEYVRDGYNQAMREKRSYIGFLMILMQRLVVSSTTAIRTTLERRLEALKAPQEQLPLFPMYSEDEWADLNGQEQIETLLTTRLKALKNERAEVKLLLEAATRCMRSGADAKAEALLDWLYKLQAEEGDPELKALVFTEFVPTQQMLQRFLTERGFPVVCLNGSMDMDERKKAQEAFAEDARILISTDAGGEGLNLQFCHVVINYDIPWNPMRLEQRIGRVDRIGQKHVVRAVNFVFEDSVEHRVREVLEEKLAVIFEEFGIDKTGDVLDSAQAGQIFDDLYVDAILNPEGVDASVDKVITRLQEQTRDTQESSSILGATEDLEPSEAQRLMAHPLPHWVERMTVSYLRAYGGKAVRNRRTWNLTWPDGEVLTRVVFSGKEAEQAPTSRHLTLEDSRIRGLAMKLPRFAPGQPVSVITIPGITDEVTGLWSLWRIGIATMDWNRHRIMPLFFADGGKVFKPTARHLWDRLLSVVPSVREHLEMDDAQNAFDRLSQIAEEQGRSIYDELVQEHRSRLTREREKGEYAFTARRKIIERIGLPQVRDYRLNLLRQEECSWNEESERKSQVYPVMVPLLILRVEGGE